MLTFTVAKIIHIVSAIFFIGVVSFRTFVMPVLKTKFDGPTYAQIDKLTGMRARSIIKINNIFLILSGSYLLHFHLGSDNALLFLKVAIGLVLALTFYIVPVIMQTMKHVSWFGVFFHYLFFSLMMVVVVLSQTL